MKQGNALFDDPADVFFGGGSGFKDPVGEIVELFAFRFENDVNDVADFMVGPVAMLLKRLVKVSLPFLKNDFLAVGVRRDFPQSADGKLPTGMVFPSRHEIGVEAIKVSRANAINLDETIKGDRFEFDPFHLFHDSPSGIPIKSNLFFLIIKKYEKAKRYTINCSAKIRKCKFTDCFGLTAM